MEQFLVRYRCIVNLKHINIPMYLDVSYSTATLYCLLRTMKKFLFYSFREVIYEKNIFINTR